MTTDTGGLRSSEMLATIKRSKFAELRISLDDYNGSRFVNLRIYARKRGEGEFLATPKGITVFLGQIAQVRDALERGLELLGGAGDEGA